VRIVAIQTSPNTDGLTAATATAVLAGAANEGAETELVHVRHMTLEACRACGNGWGTCREKHHCVIDDDLEVVRQKIGTADGLVISTPVYFGQISEIAKLFLDRLRRCEWAFEQSQVRGTPLIAIAAAGGSGGGVLSALAEIERYASHLGLPCADFITITRRSQPHKLPMMEEAGRTLVRVVRGEEPA